MHTNSATGIRFSCCAEHTDGHEGWQTFLDWDHRNKMMAVQRALSVSVQRSYNVCTKEDLRMSPLNKSLHHNFKPGHCEVLSWSILCIVETQRRFNLHNFQIRKCKHSVTILMRSLKLPESDLRMKHMFYVISEGSVRHTLGTKFLSAVLLRTFLFPIVVIELHVYLDIKFPLLLAYFSQTFKASTNYLNCARFNVMIVDSVVS